MNYTIYYPTEPERISDIYNDNIDVCVTDEHGNSYTFVVATPDNLKQMLSTPGNDFFAPAYPFLVAKAITREIIEALIESVMNSPEEVIRLYGNDDIDEISEKTTN